MPLHIAKEKMGVVWHGSFFVRHSLALVNRELASALLETPAFASRFDLGIAPFEPSSFSEREEPRFAPLAERHDLAPSDLRVTVRHRWPPDFSPPPQGHLALIQPWEFGSLPKTWVQSLRNQPHEVWVPSNYVRDCYLQSGVAAEQVFVVPNGVNTEVFNPHVSPYDFSKNPITQSIRPDSYVFLFVGGTIGRKGVDILLDAYDRAFTAKDNVTLIIKDFGTTSFYQNQGAGDLIRALQAKPGGAKIVYLTDDLSEAEIVGLYAAADCLVHPYRGEGYGLPIAEAMACGKPTVVTNHGAALDFAHAGNSYLIPARVQPLAEKRIGDLETVDFPYWAEPSREALTETLRYIVSHREEAQIVGARAAMEIAERHTWQAAAEIATERLTFLAETPVVTTFALPMGLGNMGLGGLSLNQNAPIISWDDFETRKQSALAKTRQGAWQEAKEALRAVLEERPDDWDAINALGVAHFRLSENEEALEVFMKGVAQSPLPRDFHHNIAFLLLAQNEATGALDHALQALAYTPENNDIRNTVGRAQELVLQQARKILRSYPDKQRAQAKRDPRYLDLMAQYRAAEETLRGKAKAEEVCAVVSAAPAKPRLSLCMIVKNEERFLKNCLESCKDIVDEMVIVDTGSTDSTMEIARSYGAKVIEFAWTDDFSAARNVSLDHATGDWALWLDADEEIAPESKEAFREALDWAAPDVGAIMVMFRNWLTSPERKEGSEMAVHHACRLFRRVSGVRFEGRIHEQNLRSLQALGYQYGKFENLILDHFGYAGEIMSLRNKHERFIRMLQREVDENPIEAFRQFQLFNLGNAYFTAGDMENTVKYLAMAAETADPAEEYTRALFTELVTALHRLDRSAEGLKYCDMAEGMGVRHGGISFARGYCLLHLKRYLESEEAFRSALEMSAGGALYAKTGDAGIGSYKSRYGLALSLMGQDRYVEAAAECERTLEEQPNMMDTRYLYGVTLMNLERYDEAIFALEQAQIAPAHRLDSLQQMGKIHFARKNFASALSCWRLVAQEVPNHYEAAAKWALCAEELGVLDEARDAYEQLQALAPHSAEVRVNLGRVLANLGAHSEAIDCFTEAINLDPLYSNSYFNAGDLLYRLGYFTRAAELYLSGLETEPTRTAGFFTLGNCYFQTEDYASAVLLYQQVLRLDPTHETALHNLALTEERLALAQSAA